jgi:aminoglycoside 2'-N-acetyltransferase I
MSRSARGRDDAAVQRSEDAVGPRLQTSRTAELPAATLRAARALLDDVFFPEMTDDDWEHTLGGYHALVWEGGRLVAHASVVPRRLEIAARPLQTGYVEAVAVRADRRGLGYGAAVMDAIERKIRREYELGALGSTDMGAGFYRARGWQVWQGPTWARTPNGAIRTAAEDGWIYVLDPAGDLDITEPLMCGWRRPDVW